MCGHKTTKAWILVKLPPNTFTAGELSLKIQMRKLGFPTGMGLYVGLSHPKIRLEMVKRSCTLLSFSSWFLVLIMDENHLWKCWSIQLVNKIVHRIFHLLIIFVVLEWQMHHYILTIRLYAYPFSMTSNFPLA